MANEVRKRQLGIGGLVEDAPLASGATLLTSAALAAVTGGVSSQEYFPIIINPDETPEIAYVTDLTNGSGVTGATGLLRGQEGTTPQDWPQDTPWCHAPTIEDFRLAGWELIFYSDCSSMSGWTQQQGTCTSDGSKITVANNSQLLRTAAIDAPLMLLDFKFRYATYPGDGAEFILLFPQSPNANFANNWLTNRLYCVSSTNFRIDHDIRANVHVAEGAIGALATNTWHSWRQIRCGDYFATYINGTLIAVSHMGYSMDGTRLSFGNISGQSFDLDDVRMYRGQGLPAA